MTTVAKQSEISGKAGSSSRLQTSARSDPAWVRYLLIGFLYLFMVVFILVPIVNIFYQAFLPDWPTAGRTLWESLGRGLERYAYNFYVPATSATLSEDKLADLAEIAEQNRLAIGMTLFVAALVVPLNTVFGVASAWLMTRFSFWGKNFMLTLIDLPFSVSPIIAGLSFVLIFGAHGLIKEWLPAWVPGVEYLTTRVIFNWPGVVLATVFVTFPFVARELIPVMEAQGSDEEVAAVSLGATGWQMFWRITLINIKWGLLYGLILCNARTMGEFGAVHVVSGNVRGQNTTLPLRIQQLYEDFNLSSAFALATLLTTLALVTLVVKTMLEGRRK